MTPFRIDIYDDSGTESSISIRRRQAYDFERLERAVSALVERVRSFEIENENLRLQVEENGLRLRTLDEKLIEANQRRQDAVKRIDDLIAQLDQLDARIESRDEILAEAREAGGV